MAAQPLPPGQQLAAPGKWPIVGERQCLPPPNLWTVVVAGCVAHPLSLTLEELRAFPLVESKIDIHCVTRWSKLGMSFRGVLLSDVLRAACPNPDAKFVSFLAHTARAHSTSLSLADAEQLGVLLALEHDGVALAVEHGGPVRAITPSRYFYKSVKWLRQIDLLSEDRLGYWEGEAGYHNHADPWREERYLATSLDRREAARIIAGKDFRGLDLRGIDAASRDLEGLDACDALLRNADFRRAHLRNARFDRANLSNAHFQQADLRGASLWHADLEGADFTGADLRGADLREASLFGATFFADDPSPIGARIDETTRIDPLAVEQLTPAQRDYVNTGLHMA